MKSVYITKSDIHGNGLFTNDNLVKCDIIGVCHTTYDRHWYVVHPYGTMYNHSFDSNCIVKTDGNINLLIADKDILKGEELTVNYTKQLYLEQPKEDWI